jgi:hypothetical protein
MTNVVTTCLAALSISLLNIEIIHVDSVLRRSQSDQFLLSSHQKPWQHVNVVVIFPKMEKETFNSKLVFIYELIIISEMISNGKKYLGFCKTTKFLASIFQTSLTID